MLLICSVREEVFTKVTDVVAVRNDDLCEVGCARDEEFQEVCMYAGFDWGCACRAYPLSRAKVSAAHKAKHRKLVHMNGGQCVLGSRSTM